MIFLSQADTHKRGAADSYHISECSNGCQCRSAYADTGKSDPSHFGDLSYKDPVHNAVQHIKKLAEHSRDTQTEDQAPDRYLLQ